MDTFFDIINIRDVNSHKFDLKPPISFSSVNDPNFCIVLMTGFIPSNAVKVSFLEMQKMKFLFHSKHMRV